MAQQTAELLKILLVTLLFAIPVIFAIYVGNYWSKIQDEVWEQYIKEGIIDEKV